MIKYAFKMDNVAKAYGRDLPISRKHSYEIANFIRGMNVSKAVKVLENVYKMKQAVPYVRHNRDLAHRPGMFSGRYPIKASSYILNVLNSAIANAHVQGMDVSKLHILHISVHKGETASRNGRRNRSAKRANIQIALGYPKAPKSEIASKGKKTSSAKKVE